MKLGNVQRAVAEAAGMVVVVVWVLAEGLLPESASDRLWQVGDRLVLGAHRG